MDSSGISTEAGRTITLGWTRPANSIIATCQSLSAHGYSCHTLKVKDSQALWDGSNTYTGDITKIIGSLNGKTLVP